MKFAACCLLLSLSLIAPSGCKRTAPDSSSGQAETSSPSNDDFVDDRTEQMTAFEPYVKILWSDTMTEACIAAHAEIQRKAALRGDPCWKIEKTHVTDSVFDMTLADNLSPDSAEEVLNRWDSLPCIITELNREMVFEATRDVIEKAMKSKRGEMVERRNSVYHIRVWVIPEDFDGPPVLTIKFIGLRWANLSSFAQQ